MKSYRNEAEQFKAAEIEIEIGGKLEPGTEIEFIVVSRQKLRSIAWYHNW